MSDIPVGMINFKAWAKDKDPDEDNPNMQFMCYIGQEGIKVVDGYGGWEIQSRPRRVGVVQWGGRPPLSMEVPFLMDGFVARRDVESEMNVLKQMATGHYPADGPNDPPPIVKIEGQNLPHGDQQWVISGLSWGDQITKNADGKVFRTGGVVTLLRYHEIDKLQLKAASLARKKKPSKPKPPKKTIKT